MNKKCFYRDYTILFVVVSLLVFSWFYLYKRTFIWVDDGMMQHYKALIYYSKYLKDILRGLLHGSLTIPQWGFNIGEGADIFTTLHYYVMGDPFNIFSVFVPTRFIYIYYCGAIIVRLYLAGVFFSWMCFERGKTNKFAILTGSLIYVFSYWGLLFANRHPYFLNPLVIFPLLVMGIDRIINKKSPVLFIVAVVWTAVTNVYFLYMMALIAIIYLLVAVIFRRKDGINPVSSFLSVSGWAILGILIGGIVVVPSLYTLLADSRMGADNPFEFFFRADYYSALPGRIIGVNEDFLFNTCLGFGAPALLSIYYLFKRKGSGQLKTFVVIGIIFMIFPFFGQILNGLSYVSNRWTWSLALLMAYIVVDTWDELHNAKKDIGALVFLVIYFVICFVLEDSRIASAFSGLVFIFIIYMIVGSDGEEFKFKRFVLNKEKITLYIAVISIAVNGFWLYSPDAGDYAATGITIDEAKDVRKTEVTEISYIDKDYDSNYRASGRDTAYNAGILTDVTSTTYNWSLSNNYVSEYRANMEIAELSLYNYRGYDSRDRLLALSGVKYFTTLKNDKNTLPVGYSLVKETSANYIYENENYVGPAYGYNEFITREEWEKLDLEDRESVMMEAAVIDSSFIESSMGEGLNRYKKHVPKDVGEALDYTYEMEGNGVFVLPNAFVVTRPESTLTMKVDGLDNHTTGIEFLGLNFKGLTEYDLYNDIEGKYPNEAYSNEKWNSFDLNNQRRLEKIHRRYKQPITILYKFEDSNGNKDYFNSPTNTYSWYFGLTDYYINLGSSEKAIDSIVITFPARGLYTYDEIRVIASSDEEFVNQATALKERAATSFKRGTDGAVIETDYDDPQILTVALPFSEFWSAKVDGETVEIFPVNIRYIGLEVPPGKHKVELSYKNPLIDMGGLCSLLGIIATGAMLFIRKRRNKPNNS